MMDTLSSKVIVSVIIALCVNSGILLFVLQKIMSIAKTFVLMEDHVESHTKTLYGDGVNKGIAYTAERNAARLDSAKL